MADGAKRKLMVRTPRREMPRPSKLAEHFLHRCASPGKLGQSIGGEQGSCQGRVAGG